MEMDPSPEAVARIVGSNGLQSTSRMTSGHTRLDSGCNLSPESLRSHNEPDPGIVAKAIIIWAGARWSILYSTLRS